MLSGSSSNCLMGLFIYREPLAKASARSSYISRPFESSLESPRSTLWDALKGSEKEDIDSTAKGKRTCSEFFQEHAARMQRGT